MAGQQKEINCIIECFDESFLYSNKKKNDDCLFYLFMPPF